MTTKPRPSDEDNLIQALRCIIDAGYIADLIEIAGDNMATKGGSVISGAAHVAAEKLQERAQLEALIRAGKRSAQLLTKARILLKADVSDVGDGWSDSRIAEALDTSVANIERTRRQLVEEGFESVLTRKYNPNSARPRIFDGVAEAKLIALTCGPAPAGHAKWSLRLLEEKVVELNIVKRASDNTIGRTLKKTSSSRISSSNG